MPAVGRDGFGGPCGLHAGAAGWGERGVWCPWSAEGCLSGRCRGCGWCSWPAQRARLWEEPFLTGGCQALQNGLSQPVLCASATGQSLQSEIKTTVGGGTFKCLNNGWDRSRVPPDDTEV